MAITALKESWKDAVLKLVGFQIRIARAARNMCVGREPGRSNRSANTKTIVMISARTTGVLNPAMRA